jgi:WD40-like Beta Propeller Repeat
MQAPFYVGIGVCAHRKDAAEKVTFTNVDLKTNVTHPQAKFSTVETVLQSTDARAGYVSREHLTSPGWSADGQALTFELNGQRQQPPFTPLKTVAPVGAPVAAQPENKFIYFASNQSGNMQIWRKQADGSQSEQITSDDFNNVSPCLSSDGKYFWFLSYSKDFKELPEGKDVALRMMSLADQKIKTLATFVGGPGLLGTQPWSPDGRRVVFISYQSMD